MKRVFFKSDMPMSRRPSGITAGRLSVDAG
jgi:hypothetical protein